MSKKILTVLLALVMVISVVAPLAAQADTTETNPETNCNHENKAYTDNGDGTHTIKCGVCKEVIKEREACSFGDDGKCKLCGYVNKGSMSESGEGETDKPGEGESGKPGEGESGKPGEGESGKPGEGESGKPGEGESGKPGEGETGKPGEGESGKPGEGESGKPGESEDCEHKNKTYTDNGDGKTHTVECKDCKDVISEDEKHSFDDEDKCVCGFVKKPCVHADTHAVDNGDHTHSYVCDDCDETVGDPEECTYEEGICTVCGSKEAPDPVPGLDDVPETGSIFLEWLYSLIF